MGTDYVTFDIMNAMFQALSAQLSKKANTADVNRAMATLAPIALVNALNASLGAKLDAATFGQVVMSLNAAIQGCVNKQEFAVREDYLNPECHIIKFFDGTMIAYGKTSLPTYGEYLVALPGGNSFIDAKYSVTASGEYERSSQSGNYDLTVEIITNTTFRLEAIGHRGDQRQFPGNAHFMAIGKWR